MTAMPKDQIKLQIGHTPNYATVQIGEIDLHFSYQTLIGFETPLSGLVVCENVWSTTTGKHLNRLQPDKGLRLRRDRFEAEVRRYLPFAL